MYMSDYVCANVSYLPVLCSYCGVKDPSWAELRHFVWFLNQQLESCEKSALCNEKHVGDVMAGLKSFLVTFMIQMSRVSFTSSCIISPTPPTVSLFCAFVFQLLLTLFVLYFLGLCHLVLKGSSGSRK